ncbi:MAG: lipase family protein [Myxococcaceae bacterium]
MLFKLFILVLSLSSCLKPISDISQICHAPENLLTSEKFSMQSCAPLIAKCPTNDLLFCDKPYQREIGFWYHCAPNELGTTCQQSSCSKKQQTEVPYFEPERLCEAALLSQLVYQSEPTVRSILNQKKNLEIHQSHLTSITYLFYEDKKSYHIVIEGSKSTCEFSLALGGSLEAEPALFDMKLHKGFLSVAAEIYDALSHAIPPVTTKPISITGHSLGGAAAIILAMLLTNNGHLVDSVVTFGQPQVTNAQGAKLFNQHFSDKFKFIRVINKNDLAPYFLWILDNSYTHFGPEMRIEPNSHGNLEFALLEIPDGTVWTGATDLAKIKDHAMNAYQENLSMLLGPSCNTGP